MRRLENILLLLVLSSFIGCQTDPNDLKIINNYQVGMSLAKKQIKPVLLHFTWHGAPYDEFIHDYATSGAIQKKLNEDYITITLHVDHPGLISEKDTLNLHQVILSEKGRLRLFQIKNKGQVNALLQEELFKAFYQPMYVILKADGEILIGPFGYGKGNEKLFLQRLEDGLEKLRR